MSNWCVVELAAPADRTSGGIYLPENYQENYTEAVVLAVGPGILTTLDPFEIDPEQRYSVVWCNPGDRVLFQKHSFRPFEKRIGFIRDSQLVARLDGDEVEALNEWVMVKQDPDEEMASSAIIHAEEYRPKPMSGTIVSYGPGRVRMDGEMKGVRWPVPWDMSLTDQEEMLLDRRVYWDRTVEMLSCGREELEFLLIAARDLWGMEWMVVS